MASSDFHISNGDESVTVFDSAGELQASAWRRAESRHQWLVCLYGDYECVLPPGESGVIRAVMDDFGSLRRVSS